LQDTGAPEFDEKDNKMDSKNEKSEVGQVVKGTVKSITDFGVFIGLAGNIDGLVHLSDLSWNDEGEAVRRYKNGDSITVRIDHLNPQGTLALVSEISNDKK